MRPQQLLMSAALKAIWRVGLTRGEELTPDEITALEARLVTDACADGEVAQADFFRHTGGGRVN